jgi:hypothetical protein
MPHRVQVSLFAPISHFWQPQSQVNTSGIFHSPFKNTGGILPLNYPVAGGWNRTNAAAGLNNQIFLQHDVLT